MRSSVGARAFNKTVLTFLRGLPRWSVVKNLPASAEDAGVEGSIPGLERAPEGGNGNLLQCSCLENPTDRGA